MQTLKQILDLRREQLQNELLRAQEHENDIWINEILNRILELRIIRSTCNDNDLVV
jgi:hypothetical protein